MEHGKQAWSDPEIRETGAARQREVGETRLPHRSQLGRRDKATL